MKLAPGSRLGTYEITSHIGSGGMGEVYRAHDATLKRDVALKVLPEMFARDGDRLTRFRREAQVLASLNHPNIAQIYGLEGNPPCLVMELVEGEDLAGRIAHGAMPLDDTLQIARQLADALDVAHERGIIHRDLKPANIKVRPDGVVKVLDFGLAKAVEAGDAGSAAADLGNSPTISSPALMTGVGVILGTAAYMSPEQARGSVVDKRSDIWAFGCVVYEMLTGHRAFDGTDLSEMMASVIKSDVRWDALPAGTPAGVRRLLQRCLQKDPKLRLRDIGDARAEIGEAMAAPASTEVPATAAPLARGPRTLLLGAAALAVAALSASSVWMLKPEPALDRMWLSIVPARPSVSHQFPTISPDGTRVVFAAPNEAGVPQLWLRRLDELTQQPLVGTENPRWPFWSDDGRFIAFFADNMLKRLDLDGGSPQDVTAVPLARGSGAWDTAANLIYFGLPYKGLWKVPASGGTPAPLTTLDLDRGEIEHSSPLLLPDGRSFLYTVRSSQDGRSGIYTRLLSGGEPSLVAQDYSRAEYANGYLLFGRGVSLFAQKYDIGSGRLTGDAWRVVERIGMTGGNLSMYAFSSSSNGRLVYSEDPFAPVTQITIVDRHGQLVSPVGEPGEHISMALSPDRQQLALERRNPRDNSVDVWRMSDLSSEPERFTTTTRAWRWSGVPMWMPSGAGGDRILFTEFVDRWLIKGLRTPREDSVVHQMSTGGGWPQDVTPDGQWIVTQVNEAATGADIWRVPAAGDEKREPYLNSRFDERNARVAPGGQWIAYTSNESNQDEVYVNSFPRPGNRIQISTGGGSRPVWNGTTLYYIAKNGDLMVTNVTLVQGIIQRSLPMALFPAPPLYNVQLERSQYGVIGNGERFVFNGVVRVEAPREITVVTNWLSGRE